MSDQDWQPVTITKKIAPVSAAKQSRPVHYTHDAAAARKLEQAEDVCPVKKLSNASRTLIMQKRAEKQMNQTQLNTHCSFPANTIRDIESGKLIPTQNQLTTINNALKLSLKLE